MNKCGEVKFPQSFLMYLVMNNAGLTDTQYQLVMSGIDTTAVGTLYDQARTQLNKIVGNEKSEGSFKLRDNTLYADGTSDTLFVQTWL